jgi:hypothetical protein
MIYSKKNAGRWVASIGGKVIAADPRLSKVLARVKDRDPDAVLLDLVPKTSFLAGAHAI